MESYEVDINGKTCPVKAVRNISGHNIKQYQIHGGKSIPFVKNNDQKKMEEGEVFAVETFGTTGRGYTFDGVCSFLSPIQIGNHNMLTCNHRTESTATARTHSLQ